MTASFLSPDQAAAQPSPTASPSAKDTTPLSLVDSAKAEAKKAGRQVEIPSLHTESSTTYATNDGKTLSTEFYTDPIRIKQGDAWQSVDTTLVADNGTIKPRATKAGLTLSPGGGTDLLTATSQRDGSTIKISAPQKLAAPKLSANRAEYANAYGPGIDLVVIATPTGFRQEAIIRQRPVNPLKLPVPIQLPTGLSFDETSKGKLALHDSTAKAKQRTTEIPAPLLTDTSTDLSIGEEGQVGKVTTAVEKTAAGQTIIYKPDASFLADPDVTYPVTVVVADDIIWTQLPNANDTFINNSSYQNGYANSGASHLQAGMTNSGTVRWRTYIRFEDIPADSPLRGGRVKNADLVLWNIDSNDCGLPIGSGITARRITQRWDVSTLTWSNQPDVTSEDANTEYGAYKPTCTRGYMDYEHDLIHYVNGIAQDWADGEPNYGFQLTSGNESENTNWRAYRSKEWGSNSDGSHGPELIIGYEPAPKPEIGAVGWFAPGEPGIQNRADIEKYAADPAAAGATDTEPAAPSITDEDAIQARESSGQENTELPVLDAIAEDPDDPSPDPDTLAPAVISTEPDANATSVPRNTTIKVTFSEAATGAQVVLKSASGIVIATEFSAEEGGRVIVITPVTPLEEDATYTVEASGAKDLAGNTMTAPYQWSFTTSRISTDGLVAAFGMDEGSGATVADSSGNSNLGTVSGADWVDGKYGKALSFTGVPGDWVAIPNSSALNLTSGMTLSAWVNPNTNDGYRTVIMKDHAMGSAYGLYASNGETPSAWMLKTDVSQHSIVNGTEPLPLGAWSHLAVTYDGTTARLYVNGREVSQLAMEGSLVDDGGQLHLGGNIKWGEYFSGLIDEVRVYNQAQTVEQIQADMNTPISTLARVSPSLKMAVGLPQAENLPPKAGGAFERLTPQTCANQVALAGRGVGWIMNHYSWCQMGKVVASVDHGMSFERYMADVMLIGYTFTGVGGRDRSKGETSRDLVVEAYVYNHNVYGAMPPTKRMVLSMDIGNGPRCESISTWDGKPWSNKKSALISSWVAGGRATFRFRCDPAKAAAKRAIHWNEANAQGNTWEEVDNSTEKVSNGTFRAWVDFPDWPNTRGFRYVMANKDIQGFKGNIIRCDSAEYIKAIGGCTFYLTKPAIKWSYTAQSSKRVLQMKQAYQHYWNACTDAEGETYPDRPDKIIKGCNIPGSSIPSDQVYVQKVSSTEGDANHNGTTPLCKSMWGDYPDLGKQCDEFPFASTRERTNGPNTGKWSFCPITAGHNGDAGTALQAFYQKDRVLTGDEFTNRFDRKYNDPISREDLCGVPH